MSATYNFASKVAVRFGEIGGDRETALDPALAGLIMDILSMLLPLFEKCIDARAAKHAAKNPSLLQRRCVRSAIRGRLGLFGTLRHGDKIESALYSVAAETSESEFQAILDEN
jgi:hypothetical protein